MKNVEEELRGMTVGLAGEALKARYVPDETALAKCRELGRSVAVKLREVWGG